jgi:RHS repeat-associated protein
VEGKLESSGTYRYDSLGRRVAKVAAVNGVTEQKHFLWQGLRLLREETPGQSSLYLYEPGSYAPLARVDQAEGGEQTLYYFHTDQIGTPLEMTDREGRIVWQAAYKAWGALERLEVNEVEQNLRFQGQYFDDETGLHYNTFRYYDPEVGRFITQDPIGLVGGDNLYQYVPNPIAWLDSLGLSCEPTKKYEVGRFDTLQKNSKVGDGLDIHHAAQKHPAGQIIMGYDPKTAPSIALPRAEHKLIPTMKGPFTGTARDLLAKDAKDLRDFTNAPPSAIKQMIDLNKEMFPAALMK